ncbi:MAG: ATP/ADP translocase [Candidatus Improbicoccus devescovinae]|nr:MAG: ATP/ADP translocase [Candidatus Improbicoccus devescovinae]
MSKTDKSQEFSKLRSIFWPIHGFEMKKFFSMSMLMFCILFVYTTVRDLKDIFIQKYAVFAGTELISVLKLWFVFPISILVAGVFSALVGKLGMKKTFYIITSFYALFYFVFALVLFPNVDRIHMSAATITSMRASWPAFFYYIIPCLGNWSYTCFYILAEIWGSLAISSLFWHFANEVTKKTEVRRFYALYSFIGNIAVLLAGTYLFNMAKTTGERFNGNVKVLISLAGLFCIATMLIYYYINKTIVTDPTMCEPQTKKKKKAKVGFFQGLKILVSNPYLFLIFLLPLCYGIGINLYEGVFKALMTSVLSVQEMTKFQGFLSIFTAIFTVVLTIVSTNILRKCKWRISALVTPFALLILGVLFFVLMFGNRSTDTKFLGMSLPLVAVWVGLFGNAFDKGIKYCLFDSTKSMAYIPLDDDIKAQGQGAVEIVGGRGGKAGGALIQFVLLNLIAPASVLLSHISVIFIFFILLLIVWIWAVFSLSNKYEAKIKEHDIKNVSN